MSTPENKSNESKWVSHFHVLLTDQTSARVLMQSSEDGWALPHVRVVGGLWIGETNNISAAIRHMLNLSIDFTILRYASLAANDDEQWDQIVWVLECHEELDKPPLNGRWMSGDELATLEMAVPDHRALLVDHLQSRSRSHVPPQRVPWAIAGWYEEAVDWIENGLAELGYTQMGSVEQVKNWSIASILRVPTDRGNVYFKAVADLPLFVNEPVLMDALGTRFPQHIPRPIKIDPLRRWMLMDDFGSSMWEQPIDIVEKVVSIFAQLQIASIEMVDDLLALGLFDRRLEVLHEQIDELIAHPLARSKVAPDVMAQMQDFAPALKAMCHELASYNLPQTLGHGDMHLGNVAQQDDRYLFFDWTDASLMHPFVDIIVPWHLRKDKTAIERLRDAYLAPWTAYAPPDKLCKAWRLSRPLHAIHQAVSYLYILDNQEPLVHQELEGGLAEYATVLVVQMENLLRDLDE